jgi:hypothetical protein
MQLLAAIGFANRIKHTFSVPRKPGMRKSNNDQSSSALFWIGVPERMRPWLATTLFTACVSFAFEFLMM